MKTSRPLRHPCQRQQAGLQLLRAPRYFRKSESGSPAPPRAKKKNPQHGRADDAVVNDGPIGRGQGTGRPNQASRTTQRRQPIIGDPAPLGPIHGRARVVTHGLNAHGAADAPEAVAARPDELNLTTLIGKAHALLIGHPKAKAVGKISEATNNRPEAKTKTVMTTRQGLHAPINIQNPMATVRTRPREKIHWRASSLP